MPLKLTKCLKCNNCDVIHTSVVNDCFSSCPSDIQECAACIAVNKLKLEVEETMERLKQLLQSLRQAKEEMNQKHSTIFKKLPVEIFHSIFESYVSAPVSPRDKYGGNFDGSCRRKKMVRATVLSQVCSHWRQVALATPRIWTTIALVWDECAEEIDLVREWFSRTRGFPLDVYMTTSYKKIQLENEYPEPFNGLQFKFYPFMEFMASTSAQWRYFTAYAPYCVLEKLGWHMKDLALLEELNIQRTYGREVSERQIWDYCQPAPKSIHLIACRPNKMNIQWSAVTTMKVTNITTEECITLLSSASNLITCIFEDIRRGDREEGSWHINRPAIKHEKIQNFTYDSDCSFIFYHLKLPNLRSFTCRLDNFDGNHEGFFKSMLDLKELSILSVSCNAETLQSVLSKVPETVTHLSLTCEKNYRDREIDSRVEAMRVLNQTLDVNTDDLILPNLTSLEIRADTYKFPWNYVPKCFGPIVGNTGERNGLRRRPLSRFRVTDETRDRYASDDNKGRHLIPAEVLTELVALQRKGAEIMFQHKDGTDMLAKSVQEPLYYIPPHRRTNTKSHHRKAS